MKCADVTVSSALWAVCSWWCMWLLVGRTVLNAIMRMWHEAEKSPKIEIKSASDWNLLLSRGVWIVNWCFPRRNGRCFFSPLSWKVSGVRRLCRGRVGKCLAIRPKCCLQIAADYSCRTRVLSVCRVITRECGRGAGFSSKRRMHEPTLQLLT